MAASKPTFICNESNFFCGETETRTLAPCYRPNTLAMCPLHQLGYLSLCPSKFTSYGLFRIYWWITPHLLRCLLWYLTIFNTFHQAGTSFRFHLHGWSNLEFTRHLPWYTQWSVLGRLWANNGAQTRNPQLGRLVLYQLSYIRKCSRYGIRTRDFENENLTSWTC